MIEVKQNGRAVPVTYLPVDDRSGAKSVKIDFRETPPSAEARLSVLELLAQSEALDQGARSLAAQAEDCRRRARVAAGTKAVTSGVSTVGKILALVEAAPGIRGPALWPLAGVEYDSLKHIMAAMVRSGQVIRRDGYRLPDDTKKPLPKPQTAACRRR